MDVRTSLLVLSTLLIVSHSANACNGTFHTSDGSVCTWFDVRPTVHDSALAVACSCKSELNQSQSYGCQYLGELYSCREFRDDPSCVFDMIVRQVEGYRNGCEVGRVPVVGNCPEVILKQQILLPLKSPCVIRSRLRQEL